MSGPPLGNEGPLLKSYLKLQGCDRTFRQVWLPAQFVGSMKSGWDLALGQVQQEERLSSSLWLVGSGKMLHKPKQDTLRCALERISTLMARQACAHLPTSASRVPRCQGWHISPTRQGILEITLTVPWELIGKEICLYISFPQWSLTWEFFTC